MDLKSWNPPPHRSRGCRKDAYGNCQISQWHIVQTLNPWDSAFANILNSTAAVLCVLFNPSVDIE